MRKKIAILAHIAKNHPSGEMRKTATEELRSILPKKKENKTSGSVKKVATLIELTKKAHSEALRKEAGRGLRALLTALGVLGVGTGALGAYGAREDIGDWVQDRRDGDDPWARMATEHERTLREDQRQAEAIKEQVTRMNQATQAELEALARAKALEEAAKGNQQALNTLRQSRLGELEEQGATRGMIRGLQEAWDMEGESLQDIVGSAKKEKRDEGRNIWDRIHNRLSGGMLDKREDQKTDMRRARETGILGAGSELFDKLGL